MAPTRSAKSSTSQMVTSAADLKKSGGAGAFQSFLKGIRSLWATRQTEETNTNRELYVKTTLRELIVYIVFLVILCVITFGMTSTTMYYFTNVMQGLFLETPWNDSNQDGNFQNLGSVEDFWDHLNKLFLSFSWRYFTEDELHGSSHWGMLNTYSGAGSYVDLGTRKDPSTDIITHLFDKLWIRRGTRAVFIDFTVYNANINLFCVVRLLAEFPATGGVIPSWTFRTVKLIRYVSVGDYFILACEVIFCLFILYYMVEEILEIKKHKLSYFKSFWNILDIVVIIISIVCIGFNIYRTLEVNDKLTALLKNPDVYSDFERLSYWETRFSNAIAIAVFMAWIKVSFNNFLTLGVLKATEVFHLSTKKEITQLGESQENDDKHHKESSQVFSTATQGRRQLGHCLVKTYILEDLRKTHFCLFRIILGDFDFHQLEQANRILGPIFFMLFVFFVFFVLINMFLAIINDTYSEVKSDMANAKNEFEIADYFKKGYEKMLDKLNFKRDKIVDIQKALRTADINQDKQLDFDEWRQDLKSRGYADGEIEAMFSKYDCDGDRVLDEEEQKRMQADLADQKAALNKEYEDLNGKGDRPGTGRRSSSRASFNEGDSGDDSDDEDSGTKSSRTGRTSNGVSYEEFTVLSRRVDRMEHSIGSIVSKIDAVLVKLEAMEKAKLKRRETMGKILDSITEVSKSEGKST
uniref:EF-hand domain-containing protein n=1 Tax=Biomphalaria glabrata TaxID=6526 RepID=A0A2C9JZG1_BIOGL